MYRLKPRSGCTTRVPEYEEPPEDSWKERRAIALPMPPIVSPGMHAGWVNKWRMSGEEEVRTGGLCCVGGNETKANKTLEMC